MKSAAKKITEKLASQRGVSLLETVMAVSIMLVLITVIFSLMRSSLQVSTASFRMTDAQDSTRIAQEYISRDLISAGDGMRNISGVQVPYSFAKGYLAQKPVTTETNPSFITLNILTSDNGSTSSTPSGVLAGTDRLTILSIDPDPVSAAFSATAALTGTTGKQLLVTGRPAVKVGDFYMVTAGSDAVFLVVTKKENSGTNDLLLSFEQGTGTDDFGLNVLGQINYITKAGKRKVGLSRMRMINYFVDSAGNLIKRIWGGRQPMVSNIGDSVATGVPIADHIDNLQFRYVQATSTEGGDNVLVDSLDTPQALLGVRQVEITITAKSNRPDNSGQYPKVNSINRVSVRNLQFFRNDADN